jgi:branched-chain amino acid transport system substrate-binding protein
VAEQSYPLGETHFRPQLEAIKAANPDVIVPLGLGSEIITILDQGIREVGIRSLWGPTTLGLDTPANHQRAGALDPFVTIETSFGTYDTPRGALEEGVARFRADYGQRWGEPPGTRASNAYDALFILKQAIEEAGSSDRAALRASLARLEMPALTQPVQGGRIRFNEYGEARFDLYITQLFPHPESGEIRSRIIWPRHLATASFRLP